MLGEIPWRKERLNGEAERRTVTRKVHSHWPAAVKQNSSFHEGLSFLFSEKDN